MISNLQSAAFFDVDGTLTSERVWRGLLDYFKQRHLKRGTHWLYLGLHFPTYILRKLGLISEVSFRRPWAANLAWYLGGYTPEECEPIWGWIIREYLKDYWRKDILAILQEHLRSGEIVVLVSSGPAPLIQRIADTVGTEHAIGTQLEIVNGQYTGRSLQPICIDQHKASMSRAYLDGRNLSIDFNQSHSYADSISDLEMLAMVGYPVAVYPDASLQGVALARKWQIYPPNSESS